MLLENQDVQPPVSVNTTTEGLTSGRIVYIISAIGIDEEEDCRPWGSSASVFSASPTTLVNVDLDRGSFCLA
jgi:hypothetical protein